MLETMEHFFLDQQAPQQNDAYRIGRRQTRSSAREDEVALEEEIEALGAHLSFAEQQYRAIADALGDGPPVTLESFFEEPIAHSEYQLFVTSEIHDLLDPTGAADHRFIDQQVTTVEVEASASEPSSPAAPSITSTSSSAHAPAAPQTPSAAAMFRAAAAAAASPSSVVGPRSRRRISNGATSAAQPPRTRGSRPEMSPAAASFDSFSVTSEGDDSFDAFDEINIELTEVTGANERVTTVITSVSPTGSNSSSGHNKRRANASSSSTPSKRGTTSTPANKRGRRTTNTTSFTVIETTTETNYLAEKSKDRTGSFAGEEVLRISSVIIEEDVDILN